VITNNGLWIRDVINGQINIINASKIDKNFLIDAMVSEFDKDFNSIRHIKSPKIDIEKQEWVIYEPKIFNNENSYVSEVLKLYSNFDYQKIQNLFSNLSSLSLLKLFKLRKNYKLLNYSTTETDIQIHKIISYPIYLTLMTILAAIIMFNTKHFKNTTMKLAIGLFLSVIIYYINNFFYVMGNTEKISVTISIWLPLFFLSFVNIIIIKKINEK
jgi:lipopolysaccharide export system permease protein